MSAGKTIITIAALAVLYGAYRSISTYCVQNRTEFFQHMTLDYFHNNPQSMFKYDILSRDDRGSVSAHSVDGNIFHCGIEETFRLDYNGDGKTEIISKKQTCIITLESKTLVRVIHGKEYKSEFDRADAKIRELRARAEQRKKNPASENSYIRPF